jgi:hypothetical protein
VFPWSDGSVAGRISEVVLLEDWFLSSH